MAFPAIPTTAGSRILFTLNTAGGATKTFPSLTSLTKSAGDLLLAIIVEYDGNSTNAEFSSWGGSFTEVADRSGTTTMAIGVAYKFSTGSETGTFTVTTADTSTNDSVLILMSISGAHASAPPEVAAMTTGTGAAADHAALSPSWGSADTLWISVMGGGEDSTTGSFTGATAAPGGFGSGANSGITADVVGGVNAFVSFAQEATATQDASTGTVDITQARNAALTIAVRPPAGVVDATATPATINAPAAIPAATKTATAEKVATTINAPAAIPTPVTIGGTTAVAFTINAPAAIPAVTLTATSTKTATTVNAPAGIPAVTKTASADKVATTVSAPVSIPASTRTASVEKTTVTVNLVALIPAVTKTASVEKAPATINAPAAIPAATKTASVEKVPNTVNLLGLIPQAAAFGEGAATVFPATVSAPAVIPLALVISSTTKQAVTVNLIAAIPASTRTATANLAAVSITVIAGIPLVTVLGPPVIFYNLSSGGRLHAVTEPGGGVLSDLSAGGYPSSIEGS